MMDLPPALTDILHHLLNTYGNVKSWNIFEVDNRDISVNIRFNNINNEHITSHVEPNFDKHKKYIYTDHTINEKGNEKIKTPTTWNRF
jgi:hypothetical protein